jgi:hypothetical protein
VPSSSHRAPPTGLSTPVRPPTCSVYTPLSLRSLRLPLLHLSPSVTVLAYLLLILHPALFLLASATYYFTTFSFRLNLLRNLSVHKLTRDNLVSVELDPFGFLIKDLHTRLEMLRCDSDGDLYPLNLQPSRALHAAVNPVDLWHQRLGHPGRQCLLQALRNFNFSYNKSDSHTC